MIFTKFTSWFKNLPTMAIWIVLFLFYFTIGAQLSLVRGLVLAAVLTPIQFTVYTLNLKRFMPRYYDTNKKKFRLNNTVLILLLATLGVSLESIYFHFNPDMAPPHRG
ncbi:hypothetical protein [Geofilum rubicundum]|uniref:Uncharacterized protein n=1 Tax=Geofilum rubicundum JCM 15548 TaxID=1236989 RepID=A0A0E9M0T1_9BACT|nr:hypothetical protein [Geofilum rubicundum]GAO30750.1 hypothetical protein JCM15548_13056 [Geofilum rubicundum JCM 15548]